MRKLRGQIIGGIWVYWSYVYCSGNHFIIEENSEFAPIGENATPWLSFYNWHAVIPETVGQWSGMEDNNSEQLYEGDVFDIDQTVNGQCEFVIMSCLPKLDIRYKYDLKRKYEYDVYDLMNSDFTITGNIFNK